jgi:hypothetical protein
MSVARDRDYADPMAFCAACGTQLEPNANFCARCGAPATVGSTEVSQPDTTAGTAVERSRYDGLFGRHRRNKDFGAQVEAALADDLLTQAEEDRLLAWATAQGVTDQDWRKRFADLLDRMLIAAVNDGRMPDITAQADIVLKRGEVAHLRVPASLMKEVAVREFRGGGSGVSIPIVKGVRYRTGSFRGRSIVVGTELQVADQGSLWITSLRAVFVGTRKTLELPYARLAHLNVFTDGVSFNVTNRQSVPLFKVPNGEVVAAVVNAAAQRAM